MVGEMDVSGFVAELISLEGGSIVAASVGFVAANVVSSTRVAVGDFWFSVSNTNTEVVVCRLVILVVSLKSFLDAFLFSSCCFFFGFTLVHEFLPQHLMTFFRFSSLILLDTALPMTYLPFNHVDDDTR